MPDLREAMIMLGVIGASLKPQNSRIRFGWTFRSRMKNGFCPFRPATDCLPIRLPRNGAPRKAYLVLTRDASRAVVNSAFAAAVSGISLLVTALILLSPFAVLSRSLFLPSDIAPPLNRDGR